MKITKKEFRNEVSQLAGYCAKCDKITRHGTEADATDYNCPECNNNTVMGLEWGLVQNMVEIN